MSGARTVFVTGATGLVGSHVVEAALARGHRVRALVRPTSDTRWLDRWGVEQVRGDLADAGALRRGVDGADWVVNCAAKVGDWGALEDFRRLNVTALGVLLEIAAERRVERFIHVSSLGVYEPRDHYGTDETTPPARRALDGYTCSKVEAEALVLRYAAERGLPAAIVRPGFIYGPRDRTVLPKVLDGLRSGRFVYFGSGEQTLNCVYVGNLVHAIFLAAERPEAVGQVFNITDGVRVTKRQFVGRVAALAGLRPPAGQIPRWVAWVVALLFEAHARWRGSEEPPPINRARYKFLGLNLDFSIAKAQRLLGYRPPVAFEDGLTWAMDEITSRAAA